MSILNTAAGPAVRAVLLVAVTASGCIVEAVDTESIGSVSQALVPPVTINYEPQVGGAIRYLPMARDSDGTRENHLSLSWRMTTPGPGSVTMTRLVIDFPGSSVPSAEIEPVGQAELRVVNPGAETISSFTTSPREDIVLPQPAPSQIRLRMSFSGFTDPVDSTFSLAAYTGPAATTRFVGAVGDLREDGEFWTGRGVSHACGRGYGCQHFANDLGIRGWTNGAYDDKLPNPIGANSDYRVWRKPLYAAAAGTVVWTRENQPDDGNASPTDPAWPNSGAWGNGVVIDAAGTQFLYAHMNQWSVEVSVGTVVAAGDFLGRVGNSGNSGAPHLHFEAWDNNAPAGQWSAGILDCPGRARPLLLDGVHALDQSQLANPITDNWSSENWAGLVGRGIPNGADDPDVSSLLWPSGTFPVSGLAQTTVRDFAIGTNGQLWTMNLAGTGAIRTTNDRLRPTVDTGVFLDVNPAGSGNAVEYVGGVPYVIGTDSKVWRGTASGWVETTQIAIRIAADTSSNKVWAIDATNHIHSFNPGTLVWSPETPPTALAKDVAVFNGTPFVIGSDDRVWKRSGGNYFPISGASVFKRLAVDGASGKLWGIGLNDDNIYSSPTGSTWTNYFVGAIGKDVKVYAGVPFVVGTDNRIWRGMGSGNGFTPVNVVRPE